MDRDIQQIPLNSIELDQKNVRFGGDSAKSQQEAIELMMSDEDDIKKLVRLANHIATYGLDPTELQLVIPRKNGSSYIVIEGNRRLTALKMLQNPALCPVDKYIKQFRDASFKLNGNFPSEIACSVVKSRSEGDLWVELKHTGQNGGVGRVNWDSDIRDAMRTRSSGVDSVGKQIRTLVSDNPSIFNNTTIQEIKQIPVTTLTRLFSSAPAQKAFQLKIEKKILTPQLPLQYIAPSVEFAVSMFVNEDYNVNDIRSDDDRKNFISHIPPELLALQIASNAPLERKNKKNSNDNIKINNLAKEEKKDSSKGKQEERSNENKVKVLPSHQISTKSTLDNKVEKTSKDGNGSAPNERLLARKTTRSRKHLFPWTLQITNPRINEIYRELKGKLVVNDTPNATAIIFRVFLETSCDNYVKSFSSSGTPVKKVDNSKPVKENDSLHHKVVAVSKHLADRGLIDKQSHRAISKRASSHESIGSVDHLNMFVHSTASSPIASELKDIAQEYRPLFEGIWA